MWKILVVGALVTGCGWVGSQEAAPIPACLDIEYMAKPLKLMDLEVGDEAWCPTYSLSMETNGDQRLYVNDTCRITYKGSGSVRFRKTEEGLELDVSSIPEGLVVEGSDIIDILSPIVGYYKSDDSTTISYGSAIIWDHDITIQIDPNGWMKCKDSDTDVK